MKIVIVGESFGQRDDRRCARPDDQRPIGYRAGRVGRNRHLGRRRDHHVADPLAETVETLRVQGRLMPAYRMYVARLCGTPSKSAA